MSSADLPLSRTRIIAAALDLVDREGLAKLSMRKLGAELGVEAMSLYNHVTHKDDLLDGVVDALLAMVVVPAQNGTWQEFLRELAQEFRVVGVEHPEAFGLLISRNKATLQSWDPLLSCFTALQRAGLSDREAHIAFGAMSGFVVGHVLMETGVFKDVRGGLGLDVDDVPEELTDLRAFLSSGTDDDDDHDHFAESFEIIIAGVEARLP